MTGPGNIKFSQDYVVRTSRNHGAYAIHVHDWERLKRLVRSLVPARRLFEILSSVFFGVSTSAAFALVGFSTATALAAWVVPTMWAVLAASLILGLALAALDNAQARLLQASTEDVLDEMKAIEDGFSGEIEVSPPSVPQRLPASAPEAAAPAPAARQGATSIYLTPESIAVDQRVVHRKFGPGTVHHVNRTISQTIATIEFDDAEFGEKRLIVKFAYLVLERPT